jgi:hypothetical protein
MSDTQEEIWADAFNACLKAGLLPREASLRADDALRIYEERWPGERTAKTVGGVYLDPVMMNRALTTLEVDRRFDAHLVLKSLYTAIRAAPEQRLVVWTPPPRGG